ncbi:peptidase [Microvirga tunisiensis]|uniref:Peptidase n=1 Tax=Pannonibacter tanglangensis TaxID=2750084 RepID=A0A7X5F0T1_9HYPH|nr:SapC family protein [Pannonibacter sp. XCT-53]NBN77623.1 peptidase [Pannonibacter sp. XCT-53]
MPTYHVISRDRHGARAWVRRQGYDFAAADSVIPLVGAELSRAVLHYPIAFLPQGEGFGLYALTGIEPGRNLFLTRDGRWVVPYIPAAIRAYPFRLATLEDNRHVLCFDEDSGQLVEPGSSAAALSFFGEGNAPDPEVARVLDFLLETDRSGQRTARAVAALQAKGVIAPWETTIETRARGRQAVSGLFRVDEDALNRLPASDFEDLRQAGSLVIAYLQMVSMQHLVSLGQLADAHAEAEARIAATVKPLIEMPTTDNDTIDWSRFGI